MVNINTEGNTGDTGTTNKQVGAKDKRRCTETTTILLKALRSGNTKKDACNLASISEQTFYRWMREGESDQNNGTAYQFCESVKKSISEARNRNVVIIQKHAANNWQAAAWYLERSDPEHWGKRDKVEMTGKDGEAMEMNIINKKDMTDEEMADVMNKFTEANRLKSQMEEQG